jgi:acyl-coenzyme A synthetase/AMP-(fatty) acid ligase
VKDNTFLVAKDGAVFTYEKLLEELSSVVELPVYCYSSNVYEIFKTILASILAGVDLVLLDYDFTDAELDTLGIDPAYMNERIPIEPLNIRDKDELIESVANSQSWKLTLFTSGTTGVPKKVSHGISNLVRMVRQSERQRHSVWAYAYNPTHIAGVQVYFQALLNGNAIVDVFGLQRDMVLKRIDEYQVTNISATPTFYRMLLPMERAHSSIKRLTSGGERFDLALAEKILEGFPNAQMRNIYASTEAGSVLESKDDKFTISDTQQCMIRDDKLFIRRSLLGLDGIADEWYDTGDLVQITDSSKCEFIFVSRANEMINVGGYKANPLEIEEALCSHPSIVSARVWGKPNPVVGNFIMAEVMCSTPCSESVILAFLKYKLQDFKIPRVISFVESIATTRSGKIKRG